jgi:hypothetical protein
MSINAARPTSDILRSPTGTGPDAWRNHANGDTNLYADIDEVVYDGSDYVYAASPPSGGAVYVAKFGTLPTPPRSDGHKLHIVAAFDPAALCTACDGTMDVEIRDGYTNESSLGTLVLTETFDESSWGSSTIQAFEFDWDGSGVDYSNLYLRCVASPGAESDTFVVYQAWITAPAPGQSDSNIQQFPNADNGPVFYAEVWSIGSVNGAPIIQLYNPSGSGKKAVIYVLGIEGGGGDSGITTLCREDVNAWRRSEDPFEVGFGGTTRTGNALLLSGSGSPSCSLRGMDFTNEQFHGTGLGLPCEFQSFHQWKARPSTPLSDNRSPHWLIRPGSFGLSINPGSAWEYSWLENGTNQQIRAFAIWQEVGTR